MTKATETKLEDDRGDLQRGFRDRRRGMKLVPTARTGASKGRAFNIDVAENMFSPRVTTVDRSDLTSTNKGRSAGETNYGSSDGQIPDNLRTVITFGVFVAAYTLGFLIGRRRD